MQFALLQFVLAERSSSTVVTQQGTLHCRQETKGVLNGTNACLGVPYAKAPVGDLRWRPPQAPDAYSGGSRVATSAATHCIVDKGPESGTSEDCLFVDVFYPAAPSADPAGYPALVYFHGGGYRNLAPPLWGRQMVALEKNIVWFSVSYRLVATVYRTWDLHASCA
jgi:para-nitrobenzyl esterase